MRRVVIWRGVPGSGKDYAISEYVAAISRTRDIPRTVVCSNDDFFKGRDGEYEWDAMRLPEIVQRCFRRFLDALKAGVDLVMVNNTNSRRWEFENYVFAAELLGYEVEVRCMHPQIDTMTIGALREYHRRNVHSVPFSAIAAQAERWERYPGEVHGMAPVSDS